MHPATLFAPLAIVLQCVAFDYVTRYRAVGAWPLPHLLVALCDNAGHALLAGSSYTHAALVAGPLPHGLRAVVAGAVIAAAVASCMDADHFLEAWSVQLTDATSLQRRPFAHSVYFMAVVVAVALSACGRPSGVWGCPPVAVTLAVTTHQLRDSIRRGFWCPPLGSTPPTPYLVYLVLMASVGFLCQPLLAPRRARAAAAAAVDSERLSPEWKLV